MLSTTENLAKSATRVVAICLAPLQDTALAKKVWKVRNYSSL